ncbi:MAG: FAD-dependent oxidoreductase [Gammaproteobacteria bacterium]
MPKSKKNIDVLGSAMNKAKQARRNYEFVKPAAIETREVRHYPVIIAGAGPVGLAAAIDLEQHGIKSLVLEKANTVSDGSRAICWAKRTLEILDRLGTGEHMLEKGVVWNTGKMFSGADRNPLYQFDLLPDRNQHFPAFVNLQQYYAEEYLLDLFPDMKLSEIRWQNAVSSVSNEDDKVTITVTTPAGDYQLSCDYLIAADGCRSSVRDCLGLDFEGRIFEDNFLIVDIKMHTDFPAERHFWFNPPFNPGQTSLIHKQADNVFRIDFQLGRDIDRQQALLKENVDKKVHAFLGPDIAFEYEWVSIYTFACLRMEKFVHGRVIFAGDAAHLVSPFGARGANGGIQDSDNLCWKLAMLINGTAARPLLESYDTERIHGADENILNSSRSTDFMSPKGEVSLAFRNATLGLARDFEFARHFVNGGRLSTPCTLDNSPLNTADEDTFTDKQRPGSPCMDAPILKDGDRDWLLKQLGHRFTGLYFTDGETVLPAPDSLSTQTRIPLDLLVVNKQDSGGLYDKDGLAFQHYDAAPGTFYLVRPDQHVAARWRQFNSDKVAMALRTATAQH